MSNINELIDWLLRPITVSFGLLLRCIGAVVRLVAPRRELVTEEIDDESREPA